MEHEPFTEWEFYYDLDSWKHKQIFRAGISETFVIRIGVYSKFFGAEKLNF